MNPAAKSIASLSPASDRGRSLAFTLVEVVLAVGIATGILLVALVLYRQAAELRSKILQESERLASIRMVLDRLAGEIRSAQPGKGSGGEFAGDASSVHFTRLTLNTPTPTFGPAVSNVVDRTDMVRVYFAAAIETNGTQVVVRALTRREEPVPNLSSGLSRLASTNAADFSMTSTNRAGETLMDLLRFIRFRYWDGLAWMDSWSNAVPPAGVEIVLATDTPADDAPTGSLPPDPFRRVVHVPAGASVRLGDSNQVDSVINRPEFR